MEDPNWPPPPESQPDGMSSKLDLRSLGKYLKRAQWGALPPRKVKKHELPIKNVVTTWADVEPCFTEEDCKQRVVEVQRRHMEKQNMSDIQHHFLVGGDGNIYEGRGWYNRGPTYPKQLMFAKELTGLSIEIAFLERHSRRPSEGLLRAGADCVAFGLVGRFLIDRLLFYWRRPDQIGFVSTFATQDLAVHPPPEPAK